MTRRNSGETVENLLEGPPVTPSGLRRYEHDQEPARLAGLPLLMVGWAVIVKGLTVSIWLGMAVAAALAVVWLY